MTHVNVTIRNPANLARKWEGKFLVGTGAIDSLVPRSRLEAIGISPKGQRTYELADGSTAKLDVAGAQLEFMGEFTHGNVIFAPDDAKPLLGMTALASVGIEIDPRNQRPKKLPSVRLKRSYRQAFFDSSGNGLSTNR